MPGIFPDSTSGGVIVRNGAGVCQNPQNVQNAYCPPAEFQTSCQITALPSDCNARITAAQINALQSEMLSFAACMNPTGTWNCGSLQNLCSNFNAWWQANEPHGDGVTIDVEGGAPNTFSTIPLGVVNQICENDPAREALIACVISEDAGNQLIEAPGDGKLFVGQTTNPVTIAQQICANDTAAETLAACIISGDTGQSLELATGDGKIFYNEHILIGSASVNVAASAIMPDGVVQNLTPLFPINIPNNSNKPIAVLVTLSQHASITCNEGEGGAAYMTINPGPDFGVPAGPHTIADFAPAGALYTEDVIGSQGAGYIIPPGGRTINVRGTHGSSGGGPTSRGGATLINHIAFVSWYGTTGTTFN